MTAKDDISRSISTGSTPWLTNLHIRHWPEASADDINVRQKMTSRTIIADLSHASLELNDNQVIEKLSFTDDVRVVATLGTKDGAVCGPILRYNVLDDDSVEIVGSDGAAIFTWRDLHVSGDTLTVTRSGTSKTYSITRAPKRERFLP